MIERKNEEEKDEVEEGKRKDRRHTRPQRQKKRSGMATSQLLMMNEGEKKIEETGE